MVCMIDWVSAEVPCLYKGVITGGQVLTIDRNGVIEFQKERGLLLEGSHSSKLVVRSGDYFEGHSTSLRISGNLVKFLQGHNLFGTADLRGLVALSMDKVADLLDVSASEMHRESWRRGYFELSRVDITRSYEMGSSARVRDWLVGVGQVAHSRYQAAGNKYAGTVYIGQNSRRKSLKFYDKSAEIQKAGHRLPDSLLPEYYEKLCEFASGKLRCEATLRSMWLKDKNLSLAVTWAPELCESILDDCLGDVEMNDTMKLNDDVVGKIPAKLLGVYEMWRAGRDIRSMYSDRHFKRLRSQLLPYGIDIIHVQAREVVTENQYLLGAPLKSFLTPGGGVPVPDWALGTPMYVAA